jgi:hypothetical protein
MKIVRDCLKEIYRFRDLAVHPTAKANEPVRHPELDVGVEWRFVAYRYENAQPLVRAAIQLIDELVSKGNPKADEVAKYANYLKPQLDALQGDVIFA